MIRFTPSSHHSTTSTSPPTPPPQTNHTGHPFRERAQSGRIIATHRCGALRYAVVRGYNDDHQFFDGSRNHNQHITRATRDLITAGEHEHFSADGDRGIYIRYIVFDFDPTTCARCKAFVNRCCHKSTVQYHRNDVSSSSNVDGSNTAFDSAPREERNLLGSQLSAAYAVNRIEWTIHTRQFCGGYVKE